MKKTNAWSIRKQLIYWLVGPYLFLSIVSTLVTYDLASLVSNEVFDEGLYNTLDSVAARIDYLNDRFVINFPTKALSTFHHQGKDNFYYKIYNLKGEMVSGDAVIPTITYAATEPHTVDGRINGAQVRIMYEMFPAPNSAEEPLVVAVAETCNARVSIARKILVATILLEAMFVLIGVAAIWWGINSGLAPLRNIGNEVRKRSPTDLTILTTQAPKEVIPLLDAINQLLLELKSYIGAQSRFVSNAAHQLRTPLAGLKTFVDLGALQANDERASNVFKHLNDGVSRMTQIVNRLLTLARAESASVSLDQVVDLNQITEEAVHTILKSRQDRSSTNLVFQPAKEPALINGSKDVLHDLVENLVDNAVAYTPNGGQVVVSLVNNGYVELCVEDNGPGIPQQERERVFDQFYRLDCSVNPSGSGLGLSIVREIADKHQATVAISEGKSSHGCCFSVKFKPYKKLEGRD